MRHTLTADQTEQLSKPLATIGIGLPSARALAQSLDVLTLQDLLNRPYPEVAAVPGVDAAEVVRCVRAFVNRQGWQPGDTYVEHVENAEAVAT